MRLDAGDGSQGFCVRKDAAAGKVEIAVIGDSYAQASLRQSDECFPASAAN